MKKHVFYVECQLFKIGFNIKKLLILFIKNTNRMKKIYTFFLISFAIFFVFGQGNLYFTSTLASGVINIHKWNPETTWPGINITNSSTVYNNSSGGGFYSHNINPQTK